MTEGVGELGRLILIMLSGGTRYAYCRRGGTQGVIQRGGGRGGGF